MVIKFLSEMKKPVYQGAASIGPWFGVFNFLCIAAVVTNSLIIGFTSNQLTLWLDYPTDSEKWLVVLGIEHGVLALLYILAAVIPNIPEWIRVFRAKSVRIAEIEGEYQQAINQWKQESSSKQHGMGTLRQGLQNMISNYHYDPSEDEKDNAVPQTGTYGLSAWDEPGLPQPSSYGAGNYASYPHQNSGDEMSNLRSSS